ncbi:MAG: helix-turn-helix domain-containing protein, partial [Halanaerobium sp.]
KKSLTLSSLADKFNYSPAYLSRAFKEVTGFNFVEYKNNVRIKEAGKLLQQSKLSVTEIATEVGFNNITHFGRIFKEITDLSPLAYRKVKDL